MFTAARVIHWFLVMAKTGKISKESLSVKFQQLKNSKFAENDSDSMKTSDKKEMFVNSVQLFNSGLPGCVIVFFLSTDAWGSTSR